MATSASSPNAIKIAVVGDPLVGKTAVVTRYLSGEFKARYDATVFNNQTKEIKVDENKTLELDIWDTSGDFPTGMRALSVAMDVDVLVLTFGIDNPKSLQHAIRRWLPAAKEHHPTARVILVGTKSDLRAARMGLITRSMCWRAAAQADAITYMECSALTGAGVEQIFDESIRIVVNPTKPKITFGRKKLCTIL